MALRIEWLVLVGLVRAVSEQFLGLGFAEMGRMLEAAARMSLASDQATLYGQGFVVDATSGQYRIVRTGVDHGPVKGGDLGPIDGTSGLTTAVRAAVGIVDRILADEAETHI
jgi:hypothetical protein